jgi:hypothetical protein
VLGGSTHYTGTNGNPYIINGVVQPPSSPNYPGIIDSQTDVHDAVGSPNYPWPAYATYNLQPDSDHDGLPDWWEIIKGTNPNSVPGDFSDANADPDGDGYSNLEEYLNWLATPHVDCPTNASVDVDLTQFTRGFTNNTPTYTVSSPTNGTVTLVGGKTAHFSTTIGTNALGSFKFVVSDAQGASLTNVVGIHIQPPVPSNSAPIWTPVPDQNINVGFYLVITNIANDTDQPPQTLTYALAGGPTNSALDANGVFTWRPLTSQGNSTNLVVVQVTDDGTPPFTVLQGYNVIVNPLTPPSVVSPAWSGGRFNLSVNGQTGPDYAVQTSSNLTSWNILFITNSPAMPFSWSDSNAGTHPVQFYRIKTGPPLP